MEIEQLNDRGDGEWFVVKIRTQKRVAQALVGIFIVSFAIYAVLALSGRTFAVPLAVAMISGACAVLWVPMAFVIEATDVVVGVADSWLIVEHKKAKKRFGASAKIALEGEAEATVTSHTKRVNRGNFNENVEEWAVWCRGQRIFGGLSSSAEAEQVRARINQAIANR